jgi:hypothetical protein
MRQPPEYGAQPAPIHTATGRHVWYLEPSRTAVVEQDLYAHLSRQCRYAGAVEWTVLQHLALCVELARPYGPDVMAYAAAHDLHEAYVPDLPWALARLLPGYAELSNAWEQHVHTSVGLEWPPPVAIEERVKRIDILAVHLEVHAVPSSVAIRQALVETYGAPPSEALLDAARACQVQPRGLWARVWGALPLGKRGSAVLSGNCDIEPGPGGAHAVTVSAAVAP